MAPPSAATPSRSVDHRPELGHPIRSQCILSDRGSGSPSTTTQVHLSTPLTNAPLLPSLPQSKAPGLSSFPTMETLEGSSQMNSQFVCDILDITLEAEILLGILNPNSTLHLQAPWVRFFYSGCLPYMDPCVYAERLVSHTPWNDKSTFNLLARMFRDRYSRVFNTPWVANTAPSRVIAFLGAVEDLMSRKRLSPSILHNFRISVRQVALDAFHLSISRNHLPKVLHHSYYLGELFLRGGPVHQDDILRVLAHISAEANRAPYLQIFYYFLAKVIEGLYPHTRAIREIQKCVKVLRATFPVRKLQRGFHWYLRIIQLLEPYLNNVPPDGLGIQCSRETAP